MTNIVLGMKSVSFADAAAAWLDGGTAHAEALVDAWRRLLTFNSGAA